MLLDLSFFSELYRKHPFLHTVREHIDSKTRLASYLKDISFSGCKSFYLANYGDVFLNKDPETAAVIAGTTEMLFKLRLAKKLNVDLLENKFLEDSMTLLLDYLSESSRHFLDRNLSSEIGPFVLDRLDKRSSVSLKEGFENYGDDDIGKALFLYQLINFRNYKNFKVFNRDWIKEYLFIEEVEMLFFRTWEVLSGSCEGQEIDFFPVFGNMESIVAFGDLLVGDKLINFCGFLSRDTFERQSTILRSCQLIEEWHKENRAKECYIYELRRGKLWRLT